MSGSLPVLSLQMGSLYASNDASSFTGTGGPWGFSPWTSQFGGIVSSAGLSTEPFDDTVYEVATGDEVIFVIAVQNTTPGVSAYDVRLHSAIPQGFAVPVAGTNLTVTDGTGTDLPVSGDLFGPAGLTIGASLPGYNPDSGQNVALITYALAAGPSLPGPYATVSTAASLVHVAATPGGADISASSSATAATTIVTAAPAPLVQPETDPGAVARGQTIAFDVTIPVPTGTLRDLRLDTTLPSGAASLSLVSANVLSIGPQLQLGTPQIAANGTVQFGTVTSAGTTGVANSASIIVRILVRAAGAASGAATLDAVLSAADPSSPGGRWSAQVASSVGVIVPPASAQLSGIVTQQHATTTMNVRPFADVQITDGDRGQIGTLAITLRDGALGRLSGSSLGNIDASGTTFYATGSLASLQQAAQQLVFKPSQAGTEQFTFTLVDAAGGVTQNNDAAVAATLSVDTGHTAQHFQAAPQATFLTASADGQQTVAEGEVYAGPVNYLQWQYISDGLSPIAIAPEVANVYVKNFVGTAAVALLSGQNVVDAGQGSNFVVSGSGTDTFFLDGRGNAQTWDTIVGFHAGDVVTLWGYHAGTSRLTWDNQAGAPGYTGRTLRADLTGQGQVTASVTFAGATQDSTDAYAITTGRVGGTDYMAIIAR